MKRWFWAVAAVLLVLLLSSTQVCFSSGLRYGLWVDQCPDGEVRQTIMVSAPSVSRGAASTVSVAVVAHYTTGKADALSREPLKRFTAKLSLLGSGAPQPLEPKDGWERAGTLQVATIVLPQVNDGEYRLHAEVDSSVGHDVLEVPLPLYTPARIHVLTDRPLYEPGNTVNFRGVVLKASDLSPLDERPGVWRVSDPNGEVLLEERASAGAWGVVTGSFPLDAAAASGTWQVSWSSGQDVLTHTFTVKPFTLPRFTIATSTAKPFYRRNEKPVIKGTVKYSSGAPVAKAKVTFQWQTAGQWPAPSSWVDGTALPKLTTTGVDGSFRAELPAVPEDLKGISSLSAALSAVDVSGDVVEGSASVMLSEDLIGVSAVSELADGLVEGFNNRLYLRATTADGRVLEGVTLNVKRLWEPTDKGTDALVDEDGVASLQIDPGPAVNVVIPAMPFRPPLKAKKVTRQSLDDSLAGEEVSLSDRLAFDRVESKLEVCTRYAENERQVIAGVLASAGGKVVGIAAPGTRLGKCVRDVLNGLNFETGHERLIQAVYAFNDEDLPRLSVEPVGLPNAPDAVSQALEEAMADVRDCLPATIASAALSRMAEWKYEPRAKTLSLSWVPNRNGSRATEAVTPCIQGRLASVPLAKRAQSSEDQGDDAEQSAVGVAHFTIEAPAKYESQRPQDTTMLGYEFLVTAKKGKEVIGSTKLLMNPGAVPNVRLRANSQIVEPGATVTIELLRGPEFKGELPERLYLKHGIKTFEAKVDAEKRTASFTIPSGIEGWASVEWQEARVVFFIRPKAQLSVKVTPEKTRYAPGQIAQLSIETMVSGVGGPAAVGLFGVDETLGQLAPLPGPDELSELRPKVESSAPFGGLDAQALAMGRVRGPNAAAATLLRVTSLPPVPEVDRVVSAQGQTVFDPNETLVDRFYVVLEELHVQTREWEAKAPQSEKMTPPLMAKLWAQSIAAVEARKESARDAWGRTLRLHRLPADLLALTDPRQVVVDGKRNREDSENWSQWVAKEQP